jgi:hypothetical protein
LKPNLLRSADQDLAVTTHPSIVKIVGQMVEDAGVLLSLPTARAAVMHIQKKNWKKSIAHRMATVGLPLNYDTSTRSATTLAVN